MLLISASSVTRTADMSHWHPAIKKMFLKNENKSKILKRVIKFYGKFYVYI
jgi:hypothetical protein